MDRVECGPLPIEIYQKRSSLYLSTHNNLLLTLNGCAHSSSSEALDDVVSLGLGPVCVDDLHVQSVVDQLVEQLFRSLFALNEHQQRRSEALDTHSPWRERERERGRKRDRGREGERKRRRERGRERDRVNFRSLDSSIGIQNSACCGMWSESDLFHEVPDGQELATLLTHKQ